MSDRITTKYDIEEWFATNIPECIPVVIQRPETNEISCSLGSDFILSFKKCDPISDIQLKLKAKIRSIMGALTDELNALWVRLEEM